MKYLSKNQIVRINKETVFKHGGNFVPPSNFLHEENLDYLVDAVNAEMFGQPLYPTVTDKAALYCYNIICNHIFSDGNKRTGLGASLVFLNMNGFDLNQEVTNETLTVFIIKIASGESNLEDCREWFSKFSTTFK
ncbi:type II toxin-antitoxin system death-on-curing family toxin [Lacihabitans lacunae]|uniref:Type II toxin-antitoxin system death-on-curing family toxin n=1 Tax=Lacihabitans lacunae TaxID=1028214 RepID=A0ABV7YX56_9BACT